MTRKPRILCLGRVLRDTTIRDISVFPSRLDATRVDDIFDAPGGGGATTACVLAQLGNEARIPAVFADDFAGKRITERFESDGVLVLPVPNIHGATSIGVVLVDEHGDARYLYTNGIDSTLNESQLEVIDTTAIDHVHIGNANQLIDEHGAPLRSWLADVRNQNPKIAVSIDTAKQRSFADRIAPIAGHIDYLFANYVESVRAVGSGSLREICTRFFDLGIRKAVVVKLGELGVYWQDVLGNADHVPGYQVAVQNENGAGDVFCGVAVHGLVNDIDISTAVEKANCVSAAHVAYSKGIVYSDFDMGNEESYRVIVASPRSGGIEQDSKRPLGYWPSADFEARYDATRSMPSEQIGWWVRQIRQHAQLDASSRILDAGCGTGRFAFPIADLLDSEVIGIDLDPNMLERAQVKQEHMTDDAKLRWIQADLTRLDACGELAPFAGSFDCIWLSSVLQQVEDISLLMDQLLRQLNQDGLILIRTITKELLTTEHVDWYRFFPAALAFERKNTPSLAVLLRVLEELGFVISRVDLHEELTPMTVEELQCKFEAKGFVWCDYYSDDDYAECVKAMVNAHSHSVTVSYANPAYLIVARRR